ncbi:MAG: aldehyde ferredoxin oxidoreductase, partial [Deltaproteobacteria bacterium]|nr:aldehyde ferredoxin oxidoreductase [Deltaproteobacteria bacterium]
MITKYGWAGQILRIDLSTGKIAKQDSREYVPKYLGGLGIGLKIMWDEVPAEVGPFDPENRIVFAVGPLTGTYTPTNGRTIVVSKSPQTYPVEQCSRGSFGGHWGAELKFAGYDAMVIEGRADGPVYISIVDDKVSIKKAKQLWGDDCYASQKKMIRECGDNRAKTLAIGISGERLSRIAAIISGTGSAAGQGGFGAVMGSKNLKGIIVRGTGKVHVATPPDKIWDDYLSWRELLPGPLQAAVPTWENSDPTSMWRARPGLTWEGGPRVVDIGDVDPHDINRQGLRGHTTDWFSFGKLSPYHVKNSGCFGCPIQCGSFIRMKQMRKLNLPESGRMHCVQFFYTFLNPNASA